MAWSWVSFLAGAYFMSALCTLVFIRQAAKELKGHKDNGHNAE